MKIDRQAVYRKYNGHCAYCGREMEYKEMQVDHLFPKARAHFWNSEYMKKIEGLNGKDVDDFQNLMPSCRRCNHYKRALDLEEFRRLITTLHERASAQYITKVAIDYGIVEIKPFDGLFYFESPRAGEVCRIRMEGMR